MSKEHRFVPIPEANTERLRTDVRLPYRLEKQVGLNVNSIEILAQIAGVSEIKIGTNTKNNITPQVVGFNSSGEALGGFISNKSLNHSIENKLEYSSNNPGSTWSHLEINLSEQAAISLMETHKKDTRDPKNWAVLIDNAIYKGLLKSGFDNLLKRLPEDYFLPTLSFGLIIHDLLNKDYMYATRVFALLKTLDTIPRSVVYGFEKKGEGHRWSIMYWGGPEIDRMLILIAGLGVNKLAAAVNK